MTIERSEYSQQAVVDRRIAESRLGRMLGTVSRLGGAALVGYATYLSARNGSVSEAALVLPGVGSFVMGMQLGLERGAAIGREKQRLETAAEESLDEVAVTVESEASVRKRHSGTTSILENSCVSVAAEVSVVTAGVAGLIDGLGSLPGFPFALDAEIPASAAAAAAAAYVETSVQRAGERRAMTIGSRLHTLLHLT